MALRPASWAASGRAVLSALVLSGLVLSACGKGDTETPAAAPAASSAPPSASPAPKAWSVSETAAKAALPEAKAKAEGYQPYSESQTLKSAYLCLKPLKLPSTWTSTAAAWSKTGSNGVLYVLEIHVMTPGKGADITAKDVVTQAAASCPGSVKDAQMSMANQQSRYFDSSAQWVGVRNQSLGTLNNTTTFTQATYLVAREQVVVLASVMALPGEKDVEGPLKFAEQYLLPVLASLDSAA